MSDTIILVFITCPDAEVARQVAAALLDQKLAACVNLTAPVQSLYTWKGQRFDEQEILLIVKTRLELFSDRLIPAVKAVHPYETPEIIALPVIAGSSDYLDWVAAETKTGAERGG